MVKEPCSHNISGSFGENASLFLLPFRRTRLGIVARTNTVICNEESSSHDVINDGHESSYAIVNEKYACRTLPFRNRQIITVHTHINCNIHLYKIIKIRTLNKGPSDYNVRMQNTAVKENVIDRRLQTGAAGCHTCSYFVVKWQIIIAKNIVKVSIKMQLVNNTWKH